MSYVRFMVVRRNKPAVEADPGDVRFTWGASAEDFTGTTEIAPGVRVNFIGHGDHHVHGHMLRGALLAVSVDTLIEEDDDLWEPTSSLDSF